MSGTMYVNLWRDAANGDSLDWHNYSNEWIAEAADDALCNLARLEQENPARASKLAIRRRLKAVRRLAISGKRRLAWQIAQSIAEPCRRLDMWSAKDYGLDEI